MGRPIALAGGGLAAHLRADRTVIERTNGAEAVAWDAEGRLLTDQVGRCVLRRGLSGRFLLRERAGAGGRPLDAGEEGEVIERTLRIARDAADRLEGSDAGPEERRELVERLARILSRDAARYAEDARRFNRIWKPIPILPPDRGLALVAQGTEGCSWGRCLFCGLYPDGSFRVKGEEEFARHIRDALSFLGRSALTRNALFFGDGDPFAAPDRLLLPLVDRLLAEMDAAARRGDPVPLTRDLYAFARLSTLAGRDAASLAAYGRRGFRRLYIGVETGDPELYAILRKPGDSGELPRAVRAVHEAGMRVGLIFLAGVGGRRFRASHRAGTIRLLERVEPREGDLVYLSPIVETPGSGYRIWMEEEGIEPLGEDEMEKEARTLMEGIRARSGRAKVAFYPLRSFVY
ncbi:MAG: radical SAM protein [Candidatus Eisenbacteria bacterium]|nr:radical SAM protein [Candidatus Eisenbacteria bacterium]